MFRHEQMKNVSGATIKNIGPETELAKVAQSFIILQQARHDADYNIEKPLELADAMAQVDRANSAFVAWETAGKSDAANEYLFSLLFREKEQ